MPVRDQKVIFDAFVAERKVVESASGFEFPKLTVVVSDGNKAFTMVSNTQHTIAFLPPFFNLNQVKFAAAHELGHVLHLMAGESFDDYEDQERFCDEFAVAFGSDEARKGNFTENKQVSERNRSRFKYMIEKIRSGATNAIAPTESSGGGAKTRHGGSFVC